MSKIVPNMTILLTLHKILLSAHRREQTTDERQLAQLAYIHMTSRHVDLNMRRT